jgi:hypothetical protein
MRRRARKRDFRGGSISGFFNIIDVDRSFIDERLSAQSGVQKEFEAIIAAVIGGCLLTGGYGSAIGAFIGAIIFQNLMAGGKELQQTFGRAGRHGLTKTQRRLARAAPTPTDISFAASKDDPSAPLAKKAESSRLGGCRKYFGMNIPLLIIFGTFVTRTDVARAGPA